jgi:hypothetical protein
MGGNYHMPAAVSRKKNEEKERGKRTRVYRRKVLI